MWDNCQGFGRMWRLKQVFKSNFSCFMFRIVTNVTIDSTLMVITHWYVQIELRGTVLRLRWTVGIYWTMSTARLRPSTTKHWKQRRRRGLHAGSSGLSTALTLLASCWKRTCQRKRRASKWNISAHLKLSAPHLSVSFPVASWWRCCVETFEGMREIDLYKFPAWF